LSLLSGLRDGLCEVGFERLMASNKSAESVNDLIRRNQQITNVQDSVLEHAVDHSLFVIRVIHKT